MRSALVLVAVLSMLGMPYTVLMPELAAQAMAVLKLQWRDNTQGRELLSNGQYRALSPAENGQAVDAQRELLARSPAEL